MIKINRGAAPVAIKVYATKSVKALDGVTKVTKAEQELEEAIAFFTDPANYANDEKLTEKTFTFVVYKDPDLVDALEKVFGKKCAYCESDFGAVTPKDIEHFRPKSEIETGAATLQPGYFWLAGEWENLLVSCPDCNRSRKHEVPGQAKKAKLGKEAQFPLADETRRLRKKDVIVNEEPVRLLLNPCVDQPEDHLTFDEKGLIHSRVGNQAAESLMGKMSITVYALQRKELVEERLKVLNQLRFHFQQLTHLVGTHNTLTALNASAATIDENRNQILAVKAQLQAMLAPGSEYLAMLREWIHVAKQRGEFARLLQFGIDPVTLI